MKSFFAIFTLLFASAMIAQQPASQTAPLDDRNVKYVNGVAPGYWPTAGSGLSLTVSAGTVNCSGTIHTYIGGTLTMTASTSNYVYLNTAASCVPATKLTPFTSSDIPIALVVTGSSTITSITDDRSMFQVPGSGSSSGYMSLIGAWSSSTTYSPGQVVTYSSHAYLCTGTVSPLVSNVQNVAETGASSLAFSSAVSSGDLIVVAFAAESNVATRTISDTLLTSYTRVGYTTGDPNDIAIFVGIAPSSGADTITFNSGASFPKITMSEFSGLGSTVNTSSFVYVSSGNPVTTSITTTAATVVFEAVASYNNSSVFTTISGGGVALTAQANGNDAIAGAFGTFASAGTYTIGLNLTGTNTTPIGVVAFTNSATTPDVDTSHWIAL